MKKEKKKISFKISDFKNIEGPVVLITQTTRRVCARSLLERFGLRSNPIIRLKWIVAWKPQKGIIKHPKYTDGDWIFISNTKYSLNDFTTKIDLTKDMLTLDLLNNKFVINLLNKSQKLTNLT